MTWYSAPEQAKAPQPFKKEKIWILDYSFYIWNGTHALRVDCGCDGTNIECRCKGKKKYYLTNSKDEVISGLHFVLSQVIYRLKAGWKVYTAFDPPRDQLTRIQLLDSYKGQRPSMPEYVRHQMEVGKLILSLMENVECYYSDCDESDDVMATLAVEKANEGHEVVVASDDKDMYPLLAHPNITLYRQHTFFTAKDFVRNFGFEPRRFDEYLAIAGDVADNFSGIKGLGEKAATELIQKYPHVRDLFNDWDGVVPKYQKKLSYIECDGKNHDVCGNSILVKENNSKICTKCRKFKNLIMLKDQLELSFKLAQLEIKAEYRRVNKPAGKDVVLKMLQELELKQAIDNIDLFF